MPLRDFDPLVREWFLTRFGRATEPQTLGWPEIRAGRDVLISAPTGSGKTLAAFLICLDGLVRAARNGPLADEVEVVYVSPLKALSNDVRKNLGRPPISSWKRCRFRRAARPTARRCRRRTRA